MKILKICIFFLAFIFSFNSYSQVDNTIEYNIGKTTVDKKIKKVLEVKKGIKSVISLCDCLDVTILNPQNNKNKPTLLEIEFDPAWYKGQVKEEIRLVDENDNITKVVIIANVLDKN